NVWAPELAHPAPQRAERALTEQRWDDASRFGAGRPRSPSRGYLDIPSSAPKTPTQGACSITIERGRRLALGAALSLAGFAPSTTGRFSGVHRGEGASFRHRSAVADSEAGLRHRTAQGCSSLVHYGSST